jgi:DNA replication and repair protein RecF
LEIRSLTTRSFRNLDPTPVTFPGRVNLILGENGEGKTNLLEAVAVLCNLRSFRTARLDSVLRHGERSCRLEGELSGRDGSTRLEQLIEIGPPLRRELKINGGSATVESYLSACPVFAVTSADTELVVGAPALRRAFIDRFAFLLEPGTLADVRGYQRTLQQRNAALSAEVSDDELEAWDARLAMAGARLVSRRRAAIERLRGGFHGMYRELAGEGFPEMAVRYRSESWLNASESTEILEESYRKRYNETRVRDRHAGHTHEGPHRHDVQLEADGRPVRDVLSSGQTKVVAAALRFATLAQVEEDRGEHLPVIIDDVDAELDSTVFSRLTHSLANDRQLLLSSAHAELVAPLFSDAAMLTVVGGVCREHTRSRN